MDPAFERDLGAVKMGRVLSHPNKLPPNTHSTIEMMMLDEKCRRDNSMWVLTFSLNPWVLPYCERVVFCVIDPRYVTALQQWKTHVRQVANLHAKLYIIKPRLRIRRVYIGSANAVHGSDTLELLYKVRYADSKHFIDLYDHVWSMAKQ